jgi:hypothetical protein
MQKRKSKFFYRDNVMLPLSTSKASKEVKKPLAAALAAAVYERSI